MGASVKDHQSEGSKPTIERKLGDGKTVRSRRDPRSLRQMSLQRVNYRSIEKVHLQCELADDRTFEPSRPEKSPAAVRAAKHPIVKVHLKCEFDNSVSSRCARMSNGKYVPSR